MDKRLPTEAEWDYAAGNLAQKTAFPWGDDSDVCSYTIVAYAPAGNDTRCRADNGLSPGPVAEGHPGDITALGVHNLSGNVSEWVADIAAPYSSPCWSGSTLLKDPHCAAATRGSRGFHGYRGGSWSSDSITARLSRRFDNDSDGPSVQIGFRCAASL
jgi:formylglycine-generating enzyme required for sulfatase activity